MYIVRIIEKKSFNKKMPKSGDYDNFLENILWGGMHESLSYNFIWLNCQ